LIGTVFGQRRRDFYRAIATLSPNGSLGSLNQTRPLALLEDCKKSRLTPALEERREKNQERRSFVGARKKPMRDEMSREGG
jgi:hypothetical protein